MDNSQLTKYFSIQNINQIRWAHSTNSWQKLKNACDNDNIHFIEGDISLSENGQIVMAHPPAKSSDLLFVDWIKEIIKTSKGLKLDFKDPQVVLSCLDLLNTLKIHHPVILNADVLMGPGANTVKFSAFDFVKQCQNKYPNGILSVGWTSKPVEDQTYTSEMVQEMQNLIEDYSGNITFPIRIFYLEKSFDDLKKLIEKSDRSLTLWNNEQVAAQTKNWIKNHLDPQKYFFDLVEY